MYTKFEPILKKIYTFEQCIKSTPIIKTLGSVRYMVVCRAAQENGACANRSEYINRNNKVAIFTHS